MVAGKNYSYRNKIGLIEFAVLIKSVHGCSVKPYIEADTVSTCISKIAYSIEARSTIIVYYCTIPSFAPSQNTLYHFIKIMQCTKNRSKVFARSTCFNYIVFWLFTGNTIREFLKPISLPACWPNSSNNPWAPLKKVCWFTCSWLMPSDMK